MKKIEKVALFSLLGFVLILFPLWLILFSLATESHTIQMPDTQFLYTNSFMESLRNLYGETGIASYVWTHLTFDLAFPILYGFFLFVFIRKYAKPKFMLILGIVAVFLAALFDWAENVSVIMYFTTITQYWHPFTWILSPISILTMIKWVSLLVAIMVLILSMIRRKKETAHA